MRGPPAFSSTFFAVVTTHAVFWPSSPGRASARPEAGHGSGDTRWAASVRSALGTAPLPRWRWSAPARSKQAGACRGPRPGGRRWPAPRKLGSNWPMPAGTTDRAGSDGSVGGVTGRTSPDETRPDSARPRGGGRRPACRGRAPAAAAWRWSRRRIRGQIRGRIPGRIPGQIRGQIRGAEPGTASRSARQPRQSAMALRKNRGARQARVACSKA